MTNTLISKIAAASIAVGALATDKTNTAQNYKYISADKILERAGDALAQAGVMVIPSITFEETVQVDYTDNYGKAKSRFDATVHFAMVLADGENQLEVPWRGRGNDYAVPDKALYKAITSGHKYFLMKLLNIGVGNEDGEHETEQHAASPVVEARQTPQDAPPPAQGKQATPTSQGPQEAATPATEDAGTPTDEEHDIISQWDGPRDAQGYAIMIGACDNEHHAGESWMASVKACRGYSQKNKREVFLHYLRDRRAKLTQLQVA